MPTEKKLPKSALAFVDRNAHVRFLDAGSDAPARLDMVAYTGGVISDHWWWGNLVIDLNGITFSRDRYPILEDHWQEAKIGHSGPPVIDENGLRINSDDVVLLDTEAARNFVKNSQAGFPYQASIYAVPISIEEVEPGIEVEVNGFKIPGPAVIWRKCEYQESSVCVFGWDKNTRAAAFSQDLVSVQLEILPFKNRASVSQMEPKQEIFQHKEAEMPFSRKKTAEDSNRKLTFAEAVSDPEVVEAVKEQILPEVKEEVKQDIKEEVKAEVVAEVKGETVSEDSTELAEGEGGEGGPPAEDDSEGKKRTLEEARALLEEIFEEYPELKSERTPKAEGDSQMARKFQRQIDSLKDRLAKSEKALALRDARSAKEMAETILETKLSASNLPEKLHQKIRNMVPHSRFMEDGALNKDKFAEAVDAEIADFEEAGGFQLLGGSVVRRSHDEDRFSRESEADADAWADEMLQLANPRRKAEERR